jgi:glycosyltransferase involved in cell wall biosynthesis
VLGSLRAEGCEIGVHGLRHDGRDLMTRRDFEERLPAVRTYAKQWDAVGYRSPATHRVWEWMPELGFDYDSSYTDTDPYEPQAGGCCSYLPFFNRDQVELPITLPQDHTLFAILGHTDGALWLDKARHIRDRGGMALALAHPDYARDPHLASAWQSLLEEFRDDDTAWRALPREVAEWWRRRAASVIRPGSNGWRIDGPAAIDGTVRLSSPPGQLTTQARGHEHSERRPGGDRAMQTRETQVHGAANDRAQATSPRSRGRICIVRHDHYLDLTVRREAEALRDAGYEVDVVCLPEHSGSPVEAGEGITLHRLPLRRRRGGSLAYVVDYVSFFVAATVTVARLHIQRPFLAVQANTMPDVLVFTALVPRLLGAKVVAFMKEPTPELGETKYGSRRLTHLLRRIEQAAIRFADMAFTVTEDLKETEVARGADAEKITVVLNGPDARYLLDHRTDAEPDPAWFTAVCHGLVDERYGHATMVRAIRLARERVPNLRLKITGRGEYGTRLQQLIEEEGVEDRVEYLGWLNLPELVDVLCRADVGIVAQESSPYSNLVHTNKMFEYMLLGKPVIASRLRSTARYFGDDAVEYFEAGSAESLAGALVALHDDPARRCRMVEAARAHYDAYGWDKQRDVYLSAYAALLGDDTAAVPTAGPRRGARGIARRLRRAWGSETTRQP